MAANRGVNPLGAPVDLSLLTRYIDAAKSLAKSLECTF
jgi:hypothetical protein